MSDVLLLADDFTGAMDTGHGFATRGCSVCVSLGDRSADGTDQPHRIDADAAEDDVDVLAIDMNTRDLAPEAAASTVATSLDGRSTGVVYKKVDSTLRGNVVVEVDAALRASGADLAIVAPAFPSTGRLTVGGRHLVDGLPLEEAGYEANSDLAALFAASTHDVTMLPLETVLAGEAAVRSALSAASAGHPLIVVCDAVHDRHLRTIAAAADSLDANVVFVGSGGLATAVSVPSATGSTASAAGTAVESPDGGILGVVGSINDRTLEQLELVPSEIVHRLEPADAVTNPAETGRHVAPELRETLRTHGRAVVTGATSPADVELAGDAALEHGVDPGSRVATALSAAAAATATDKPPLSGLFLTGGAVARAALDALSATEIELTGRAVVDGIPEGRLVDGPTAGLPIVTKAGGFGGRRSIVNCLTFLGGDDDRE
jgi:D-threonate/D-erythronate kinase